ncbi:hypothetical protein CMI45_01115 [Candidatus Pacearchaeota archaeon]|nr:hypothetical protein [Candidatus Pacearchaeota archaeon]|tara:strand:+ start:275 stop:1576 length:1302 start_codon:yes stop_codon:yes gene_type:complete
MSLKTILFPKRLKESFLRRLYDKATSALVRHTREYKRLEARKNRLKIKSERNLRENLEQATMQIALHEIHVELKQQALTILEERHKRTELERGRLTGRVLSLEKRIEIEVESRKGEKRVYLDLIETQKLRIERLNSERGNVQDRYMEAFDENADKQELIEGLFSRMKALETLASSAYKSAIEEAISNKQRRKKDSLAVAITPEGEMVKVLNLSKQARANLQHDYDSLKGRKFEDFLNEEDTKLFNEAIEELKQRKNCAEFSFDIGLRKTDKHLTPYVLRARAERSEDSERELRLITIFLDKPEFGRQAYHEGATEIVIKSGLSPENLKHLGDKLKSGKIVNGAKSGAAYRITFRGTQILSQSIMHRVGTLLASGEKVTMVGLDNLGDVGYTSFRDPSLEVPRERIGLRPPQYSAQRSIDIPQENMPDVESNPA